MGELANKIRAKYPGAYDSMTDANLEQKVISKYPGVYDHLAEKQVISAGKPDASPAEVEDMRTKWLLDEDKKPLLQRKREEMMQKVEPYVRPVVEGTMGALGGLAGFASPLPGGALLSAGLGAAAGKTLMDIETGRGAKTFEEATKRTVHDVGMETALAAAGETIPVIAKSAWRIIKNPVAAAREAIENKIKASAVKRLDAATTTSGPIAEAIPSNIEKATDLESKILGLKFSTGESTGDTAKLALERKLVSTDDTARQLADAQKAGNKAAIEQHLLGLTSKGDVGDTVAALGKVKSGIAGETEKAKTTLERVASATEGTGKEEAGGVLREGAVDVKGRLREITSSEEMYGGIDKDLSFDSTNLYDSLNKVKNESDPAFQKIYSSLESIVKRAKGALSPSETKTGGFEYFDQFGKPVSTAPKVDIGDPKEITLGQLMDFTSQVKSGIREANSTGRPDLARKLKTLLDGAEETMESAVKGGAAEDIAKLRDSNKFYKEVYIPTVRQGATAKILATDKIGAARVDDALVGAQYFRKGDKGIEAANSFNRTFGDNPEMKAAIRDHAAADLLSHARNKITGEIDYSRIKGWQDAHKNAISKLGLGNEFSSLESAAKAARDAAAREKAFNSTSFSKVVDNADPDAAMRILFRGSNTNIASTTKQLLNATADNPAAREGLKSAYIKHMADEAGLVSVDVKDMGKIDKVFQKYRKGTEMLFNKEEIARLEEVREAIRIASKGASSATGKIPDMKVSLSESYVARLSRGLGYLMTGGGAAAGAFFGGPVGLAIGGTIGRVAEKGSEAYNKKMMEYISQGAFDPKIAKQLRGIFSMDNRTEAMKRLKRNIDLAVSSGTIGSRSIGENEE